ncbi:MAG: glycosyltransferase family 9 protein [Candidatus Aminicenantia bacterium]
MEKRNTANRQIDLNRIKKLLIVRLRMIGDVIMTTPSLKILRRALPETKIYYVVEPPQDEILRGNPDLDELLIIKRKAHFLELLKFIKRLRAENFDLAIDFHGGPRASLITFLSGASLKVGYSYSPRRVFYDIKVERGVKDGYIHSVVNQLNLVKSLGIKTEEIPPLFMPDIEGEKKEMFEKYMNENGLKNKNFLVFHVSAGNIYREWGIENWKTLIKMLSEIKIAIIGSKEDLVYEENIKFPNVYSFIGKLNLKEARELIKRSLLFVGPDSGPMHIASTTETPIIALFGPTTPQVFRPWKKDAIIIEGSTECRPCNQKRCNYNFRCIREIEPERVFNEIKRLMRNS